MVHSISPEERLLLRRQMNTHRRQEPEPRQQASRENPVHRAVNQLRSDDARRRKLEAMSRVSTSGRDYDVSVDKKRPEFQFKSGKPKDKMR